MLYDVIWCYMMSYDVVWCRMMSYDVVWWHILAYFGILASTEPPIFPDFWKILWRLCPVLLIDMRYDRKLNGFRRPTTSSCFDYLHKFSNDQRHLFFLHILWWPKSRKTPLRKVLQKLNDHVLSTKHPAKRRIFTPAYRSESPIFLTFISGWDFPFFRSKDQCPPNKIFFFPYDVIWCYMGQKLFFYRRELVKWNLFLRVPLNFGVSEIWKIWKISQKEALIVSFNNP